jgi:ESAT-6 family protein
MPDGEIKVSFGGLSAGADSIGASANQIQQQLDDLKARLAPLVASWTGTAATDYQAFQKQWDTAAADLQQVLAQIGVALRTANEDYQDGERNNAARWT